MNVLAKEIYVVYTVINIAGEATEVIARLFRNKENAERYCKENANSSYDTWTFND